MSEVEELRETPATEGNISISASMMLEMLREQQKAMLQQQESRGEPTENDVGVNPFPGEGGRLYPKMKLDVLLAIIAI